MNDIPLNPTALPDGLTEEEAQAAREASQRAVEELRERNQRKAEMLAIWAPALRDLEEEDEVSNLTGRLIAAAKAHGWDEDEDDRLARLAVGIIKELELKVTLFRRRGRPDRVYIGGHLAGEVS
jgi:hypothetical protein